MSFLFARLTMLAGYRRVTRALRVVVLLVIMVITASAASADAQNEAMSERASIAEASNPQSVTSMNLCTDQYLLSLADPAQIRALTFLAHDPQEAAFADQAQAFPVVVGSAESILLTAPDLVLADAWSDPFTLAQLRKVGVTVGQTDNITDLPSLSRVYQQVGNWLGQRDRAEQQLRAFTVAVEALRVQAQARGYVDHPLRYVVYTAGGYITGSHSLQAALFREIGLVNIADELGLGFGGYLTYEQLLLQHPDVLFIPSYRPDEASVKAAMTQHPVMEVMASRSLVIRDSSLRWRCFSPEMAADLQRVFEQVSAYRDARDERLEG